MGVGRLFCTPSARAPSLFLRTCLGECQPGAGRPAVLACPAPACLKTRTSRPPRLVAVRDRRCRGEASRWKAEGIRLSRQTPSEVFTSSRGDYPRSFPNARPSSHRRKPAFTSQEVFSFLCFCFCFFVFFYHGLDISEFNPNIRPRRNCNVSTYFFLIFRMSHSGHGSLFSLRMMTRDTFQVFIFDVLPASQ